MYFLGIDAGASATKWALIDENGLITSGVREAMDGHLYREESKVRMEKVFKEIVHQIAGKSISKIYLGITGVVNDGSIQEFLRQTFNAPATVVSDIELAYRANFSENRGILLYAGTGSVAYAIDERGVVQQTGGWGYLIGDEGGGYWIGREAIRNVLFGIESKTSIENGSLASLIMKEIKASDWNSVKAFVYSQERSAIAALSRIVNMAAESGDKDAFDILRKAAGHLAELVHRTDNNLFEKSLPVKFTGGISSSTLLYRELERVLPMRVAVSTVDIAQRAAELAR